MGKAKKTAKASGFIFFVSFVFLIGFSALALAPYWPSAFWWIASFVQLAPLWVLSIPLVFLFFIGLPSKSKNLFWIHVISAAILLFGVLGFKLPVSFGLPKDKPTVKVMSINLGERADARSVFKYIEKSAPDVVVFQEASGPAQRILKPKLRAKGWHISFHENQGLASRFDIKESRLKNRRSLGDWGGIAGRYELATDFGSLFFFNVHLESAREGINAILYKKLAGINTMKEVTESQAIEAGFLAQWIDEHQPVIVAGDFNMLQTHPIYQMLFNHFQNAFAKKGFGFGATKYTRYHGVRIDHILTDKNWVVKKAYVGADVGGDHRPLFAEMIFTGERNVNMVKKEDRQTKLKEYKSMLLLEDFENSVGRFADQTNADLSLAFNNVYSDQGSLKVMMRPGTNDLSMGIYLRTWKLQQFPKIAFAYRIPRDTPVGIRARTSFGDYLTLASTEALASPHPKTKRFTKLIADGQWHEVEIDVLSSVQSVLAALNAIQSLEFFIPTNRAVGDHFFLDNFVIYKP